MSRRQRNSTTSTRIEEATPVPGMDLPKGTEYILIDDNTETSYGFQLYNFVVGILFLAFGLNLLRSVRHSVSSFCYVTGWIPNIDYPVWSFPIFFLSYTVTVCILSGSMMLLNLCIAFVHLDLGLDSHDVMQLWKRVQLGMGLCSLVFIYTGLLHSAGESIAEEGFTWPGMLLLVGVVGADTYLFDVCGKVTARQKDAVKRRNR